MLSVLILNLNEELNLAACLNSVRWSDDVVVLDSFSTDRSVAIARAHGARVFQRRFDDFGSQRNYALEKVSFKNRWVFQLDADERFNEKLRSECERVIALDRHSGYAVPNRMIFFGRWIKHCTQYPFPQVRLVKAGEISFAKAGHGQREDKALRGIGQIDTPYEHLNFSKGLSDWVARHNRYSDEEARFALELRRQPLEWRNACSRDSLKRKRFLKQVHARLPARWIWKFVYLYILRLGFLDLYPGLVYCVLQGFYDFLIQSKISELLKSGNLESNGGRCSVSAVESVTPVK